MGLNNAFDDREPESCTTSFGFRRLPEAIEDVSEVTFGDARASVRY
jgi:hypothetical protein